MTDMKKLFYLMSLCALAFVSCQKAELDEVNASEAKYTYTLVGTASPDVKASVGDKVANKYPMLWEAGDKLGVYAADGTTFIGVAEIAAESAGKNVGTFTLTTDTQLTNGQGLSIVYPYVEGAAPSVPTKQTIAAANSSAGIGANAVGAATATYTGAETTFALTYSNAYVKFVLNSTELKDYTLNGITLWADGTQLAGTTAAAEDYVKVTVSEPAVLGEGNKELWLTANPVDLTGKEVYAIVHLTKGIETVTLPVKLNGATNLPAQAVTTVTLPALAKSLAPAWYEPVETRYIAAYGDGWSYGPENTVLFVGVGQEKTIELKARGNFMKVKQPAKVKVNNIHSDKGAQSGILFINDVDGNTTNTFDLSSDYTFKAKMYVLDNNAYGYFSNLLVQDASGKTIWGLNLWLVEETMKTAAYTDGTILDRNIGACGVTSKRKNYACQGAYFQWGRPFGFPWSTSNKGTTHAETTVNNTLEKSAENPFTMYRYGNGGNGDGYPWDWLWGDGSNKNREGDLDDLWGNPNVNAPVLENAGVKSIFDPCPKGYRVASAAIIEELNTNIQGEYEGAVFNSTGAAVVNMSSSVHFVEYKGISWGFHGLFAPTSGMNKLGDAKIEYLGYWSNANYDANGHQIYLQLKNATITRVQKRVRNAATPIRCMVDTENR